MRVLACFVITLPVIVHFLFSKKNQDFLNPLNAFSILYILKVVIPTIIFSNIDNIYIVDDFFLEESLSNDDSFMKYVILQSISYCLVLLGIRASLSHTIVSNRQLGRRESDNGTRYKRWGVFFYILGLFGFFLVMRRVGGISFFYANLHLRTFLVRDLDFETYLLSLLNYAPIVMIYAKKWTKEKISIGDITLILLAGFLVGLGGRKALLIILIECMVVYHYVVKRITAKQIFNLKVISVCIFVFFFFTTYSKLRSPDAFEEFKSDPIGFYMEKNEGGLIDNIASESYVPFYVSVVDYFDTNKKWMGASFLSLMTAFIPSSLYHNKPPVDDGMYLYSIARGQSVSPPMPTNALDGTSWPLETFGSMYANFGIIGLFIGMFVLGYLIALFFRRMVQTDFSFKYVIFYTFVLFTFELSTLRIVQSIITFIVLSLVQFLIQRKNA